MHVKSLSLLSFLFYPLAVCTALTELVLNDTNAQQIVQVRN